MSDYQNSDTAKWDADQVRRQTGEMQKAAKGKKKRRFGWLIYLACVIVGSCLLAGLGWLAVNDVCALNKAPLTATIEVESGDSVGKVATKLKKAGLIDSKLLFMITSPVFHASRYIQPGVYELNTDMDFNCLIKSMQLWRNLPKIMCSTSSTLWTTKIWAASAAWRDTCSRIPTSSM